LLAIQFLDFLRASHFLACDSVEQFDINAKSSFVDYHRVTSANKSKAWSEIASMAVIDLAMSLANARMLMVE
jgi:hypothetical protein